MQVPVLAASSHEVVTAAPQEFGVKPGEQEMSLDQGTDKVSITLYHLEGKLSKTKLHSGEAARALFQLEPKNINGAVCVQILDGPVHFANTARLIKEPVQSGHATVSVYTTPGELGKFHLGWWFEPVPKSETPPTQNPPEKPQQPLKNDPKQEPIKPVKGPEGEDVYIGEEKNGVRKDVRLWPGGKKTKVTTTKTGVNKRTMSSSTTEKRSLDTGAQEEWIIEEEVEYHRKDAESEDWVAVAGTRKSYKVGEDKVRILQSTEYLWPDGTWSDKKPSNK